MILCVDIGGTSSKAGALSHSGALTFVESIPTEPDADRFLDRLSVLIESTAKRVRANQLGIAVAGFLDPERNCMIYNSNLGWLENYPLKTKLQERFPHLQIELEVDSNAAAMAEFAFGSGRGKSRFLCLTCGTGLGVGMTIDGIPLRFSYGCMGDIGHIVVERGGPVCTCGGRGCAEALVSSTAIAKRYSEAAGLNSSATLKDIITAAEAGHRTAVETLETTGEWLGVAAASMAHIFFPDHIAIAGGLSAAGDLVLTSAERTFRETVCDLVRGRATFGPAVLGPMATLIGAGCPFL